MESTYVNISEKDMYQIIKSLRNLSTEEGLILLSRKGLSVKSLINVYGTFSTHRNDTILSYTIRESRQRRFISTKTLINVLKIMLEGGVDPNIYDSQKNSPLWQFISYIFPIYNQTPNDNEKKEIINIVELLLKAGADPNVKAMPEYHLASNKSLLYFLASQNNMNITEELIEMLLKYGAKMTREEEQNIMTKVNCYVKRIHKREMEEAVEKAKQEVRDELYSPYGIGYDLTKKHFNSLSI